MAYVILIEDVAIAVDDLRRLDVTHVEAWSQHGRHLGLVSLFAVLLLLLALSSHHHHAEQQLHVEQQLLRQHLGGSGLLGEKEAKVRGLSTHFYSYVNIR